jgi:periplasmic divalent cation tolerance protein
MSEYIQVVTTTERKEDAVRIGHALVEQRLAACAQIVGPITSIYHWQGEIAMTEEWQCWAKGCREHYGEMEAAIRTLHPYQVPEILAIPVVAGSEVYLTWLRAECAKRNG